MIRAIIFDLDGVLVDAREIHYEALNNALAQYNLYYYKRGASFNIRWDDYYKKTSISYEKKKELSPDLYDNIWNAKQEETFEILRRLTPDHRIIDILKN